MCCRQQIFSIKLISCVDIIKRNSMSTLTKFSSFPKTIELGCFVFSGLLCGAAALNQPGLLSSGVTSSRGADDDKLSFATYLFPRIQVFSHNWPYTLLALHRLNRRDRSHGDLHSQWCVFYKNMGLCHSFWISTYIQQFSC